MSRLIQIKDYRVRFATCSRGFNEWRSNITVSTYDSSTSCDIRFVEDPATWQQFESVNETGWSQLYLPASDFADVVTLLRGEQPLYVVLYGPPDSRAMIQSDPEPPGDEELLP